MVLTLSIPASASTSGVLDPLELGATVYPTNDGYMLTLEPDPELTYWERYLDGNLRYTAYGASYTGNSQERLLDNLDFHVYPFGEYKRMSCNGLSVDTTWDFELNFVFQRNTTISQNFSIGVRAYLVLCDASGNELQVYPGEAWTFEYTTTDAERLRFPWDEDFDLNRNAEDWDGSDYFYVYYAVTFASIEDEDVSTNVNFTLSSSVGMTLPVNSVYGDYIQSGQTNAYLERIENELESQGQTLDQILNGSDDQQGAADDFNSDMDDMTPDIKDDLDQLEQVTKPNVDNIDTDLESMVGESGVRGTNNILTMLTGYSVVTTQFVIVLTIMLIGYVLYGKRG